MELTLDPSSIDDYRTFLQVKALPVYSFSGRVATFPDEYASRLGLSKAKAKRAKYTPHKQAFDYQRDIAAMAIEKQRFAVFADCGLGKTLILLEYVRHVAKVLPKNKCILIVSPLMVIGQTIEECQRFYGDELPIEQVRAADLSEWMESGGRIGITNYDALSDELPQGRLGGLVLDECFAKGTPVDCVDDAGVVFTKHIENIVCGDRIINASGVDLVSDIHRREVPYAVVVNCREKITCSPNHPFFTQRGWVGAQDLRPGDSISHAGAALRMVRGIFPTGTASRAQQILRKILLSEMADEHARTLGQGSYAGDAREDRQGSGEVAPLQQPEGEGGSRENHCFESYVRSEGACEGLPPIESHEPQTFRAWGERAWFNEAAGDATGCTWTDLGCGILFVTGPANCGLSHALQARLSEQRPEDGYRGGWRYAPLPASTGQKEGWEDGFTRVEGIEILEPGHPQLDQYRDAEGKLYFYDLGGTRHPSFSVAGLLVHNSSMLKSMYGKWGQACIDLGAGLDWKLCLTGTPAPNDRIEYGNHAVFLDQFPTLNAFLAKYFVNRGQTDNRWELKPHALEPFYRSLSHWCIFLSSPAVYGWKDNCEALPPIHVAVEDVDLTAAQEGILRKETGQLFATELGGITGRSTMGQLAKGRYAGEDVATNKPEYIKAMLERWPDESTIVWCLYNDEQDRIAALFPDAANIDGSTPHAKRLELIADFKAGRRKILISKAKVLGFGLNLQICTRMVFSGLQDSYESYYQAVKRANRYGSTKPLHVHIPVTDIERPMIETVLQKAKRVQEDTEAQERIFRNAGK